MSRYVKLDMTHFLYASTRAILCNAFESETGRQFSENQNAAGTLSWAKVTTNIPVSVGGCILDVEDGDNSRAKEDVSESGWSA